MFTAAVRALLFLFALFLLTIALQPVFAVVVLLPSVQKWGCRTKTRHDCCMGTFFVDSECYSSRALLVCLPTRSTVRINVCRDIQQPYMPSRSVQKHCCWLSVPSKLLVQQVAHLPRPFRYQGVVACVAGQASFTAATVSSTTAVYTR